MIKKTRLKFFFVMMPIVFVMISIFCGTILLSTKMNDNMASQEILSRTVEDIIRRFDSNNQNALQMWINFRVFAVHVNSNNEIEIYYPARNYEESEIAAYINKYLSGEKVNNIKFKSQTVNSGKIIAGIDISIENEAFNRLLLTILFIGGAAFFVLCSLIWFLSFWIVKPLASSIIKQRQFISDASHELKTPLTIILSGTELLQEKSDKKILNNIKQQTEKMTVIINDLLALSKLEETKNKVNENFDLSTAVKTEVLSFESLAFEQKRGFIIDINEPQKYKGDKNAVSQIVRILVDNAIKYSVAETDIKVKLEKTKLTVTNKTESVKSNELPFIFERFFRGSEARTPNNGTGLGLSILKNICDTHNYKIEVKYDEFQSYFNISVIF